MSPSGQIRPWYPIGMDGSLSPDSFRARRMVLTAESGQYRTHAAQRNIDPKQSAISWPPCARPQAVETTSRFDYQCTVRAGDCRRKWSRVGAGAGCVEASEFL